MSKACAPPPVGKGGSLPQAHGSAVTMDEVRASRNSNPIFDRIVFDEADEFRLKGNHSGEAVEIDVAGKMLANQRIVKHLMEDEGFKKWQKRTGMDDEGAALIVKMVIDQWATDSSPSSAFSLCQHRAAAVVHDLDSYLEARRSASAAQVSRADDIYSESGDLFEAIVRSEYKATQEWFAEHGIKEVVLHRGMALDHDSKTGDVVRAQMYPLSSWSESWSEAKYFSDHYTDRTRKNIVLSSRIPVEMIQSIPLTGRGCLMEYEFVLIGKPTEALVSFDGSDG